MAAQDRAMREEVRRRSSFVGHTLGICIGIGQSSDHLREVGQIRVHLVSKGSDYR